MLEWMLLFTVEQAIWINLHMRHQKFLRELHKCLHQNLLEWWKVTILIQWLKECQEFPSNLIQSSKEWILPTNTHMFQRESRVNLQLLAQFMLVLSIKALTLKLEIGSIINLSNLALSDQELMQTASLTLFKAKQILPLLSQALAIQLMLVTSSQVKHLSQNLTFRKLRCILSWTLVINMLSEKLLLVLLQWLVSCHPDMTMILRSITLFMRLQNRVMSLSFLDQFMMWWLIIIMAKLTQLWVNWRPWQLLYTHLSLRITIKQS